MVVSPLLWSITYIWKTFLINPEISIKRTIEIFVISLRPSAVVKLTLIWNHVLLPAGLFWDKCDLSHSEVWRLSEGVGLAKNDFTIRLHMAMSQDIIIQLTISSVSPQAFLFLCPCSIFLILFLFPTPSPSHSFFLFVFSSFWLSSAVSPWIRKTERRMSTLKKQRKVCMLKEERTRHYLGAVISIGEIISKERDQLLHMVPLTLLMFYKILFKILIHILWSRAKTKQSHTFCHIKINLDSLNQCNWFVSPVSYHTHIHYKTEQDMQNYLICFSGILVYLFCLQAVGSLVSFSGRQLDDWT